RDGAAVFPRTVVVLGEDAEATVIERFQSTDVTAFVDPVVELDIGDAARLKYASVQDLGPRVWQTGYQASRVGRDSELSSTAVALGGDYARLRIDTRLDRQGAAACRLTWPSVSACSASSPRCWSASRRPPLQRAFANGWLSASAVGRDDDHTRLSAGRDRAGLGAQLRRGKSPHLRRPNR